VGIEVDTHTRCDFHRPAEANCHGFLTLEISTTARDFTTWLLWTLVGENQNAYERRKEAKDYPSS